MEYIEIYSTNDRFAFYKTAGYLELNNIDFQKLYEFRLHAESNFGVEGEPAILRVKEKDVLKVNTLLEKGGFFKSNIDAKNLVKLKEESELDNKIFRDKIDKIIGSKIIKVHYILANEFEYDLDSIHSIDAGIVIQLENEKYLSWQFKEYDVDFENDYFIPQRYELKFTNIIEDKEMPFPIKDVTENEYWNQLINKSVTGIDVYTQEFNANKIITDLVIKIGKKRVAIFSVEEPTEKEEQVDVHLAIGNEWSIIVFDEETIDLSGRV